MTVVTIPPEVLAEVWTALYADRRGKWLLLRGPVGFIGPPNIRRLRYLGTPGDLVTRMNAGGVLQRDIADALGVTQQHVSRLIEGSTTLSDERIGRLVELASRKGFL